MKEVGRSHWCNFNTSRHCSTVAEVNVYAFFILSYSVSGEINSELILL